MDVRPLPPYPNLEQYKKQAKELLKYCRRSDQDSVRMWATHWVDSWSEQSLVDQERLSGSTLTSDHQSQLRRERIDRLVKGIAESKLSKQNATLSDAQFLIARAHGFESWPKFAKHLEALRHEHSLQAKFEAAADAVVTGDTRALDRLVHENPQLIHMRSPRRHRATLLHYVAANGVEAYRYKTPKNIVAIARLLLEAGAQVDAECDAYGGGCTALGLAATSVHPERAGVQEPLMQVLLDHGAAMDKPGVAGNRHSAVEGCLWNGRGKAAQFLAARGARLNLDTAAGVGKLDVVKSFFHEDGSLAAGTKVQLQRGFLWACGCGHFEVVKFLVDRGVDLQDQADVGATGLHWAAGGGHLHYPATTRAKRPPGRNQ